MAQYEVAIVSCPKNWEPSSPDAVPPDCGSPDDVLAQTESLHKALCRAIAFNEESANPAAGRWAVVVDRGSAGQHWPEARLCTPVRYQVLSIWWPDGWDPSGPDAVPNCAWQSEFDRIEPPPLERGLTRDEALANVRALNRQVIDHAADRWYIAAAVENEPLPPQLTEPSIGSFATYRVYVLKPEGNAPQGDCSACPAHTLECVTADWQDKPCTLHVKSNA
jgi:hypothetical protein